MLGALVVACVFVKENAGAVDVVAAAGFASFFA